MDSLKTGSFINECRKNKGLTQLELAQMLNISNRTVSKWENGDGFPDITLLPQLAEILEISVDEILAGEKAESNDNNEEILFEAVGKQEAKHYKILYDTHIEKLTPKWCTVLIVVCLIALSIVFFMISTSIIIDTVLFIVDALLIAFMLFGTRLFAHIKMKSVEELCGKDNNYQTITVTDKSIKIKSPKSEYAFELSKITAIYEKNDYLIVCLGKRSYIYIGKASFTVGNADDFASYIRANMTVQKDNTAIKILTIVSTIVLMSLSISVILFWCLANINTEEQYVYDDYISMSTEDLEQLDDENLHNAITTRIENIVYYEDEPLNDYQNVYYTADDFSYYELEGDGLCAYIYYLENTSLDELYLSLDEIGMTALSNEIEAFVTGNEIDIMDFNSKADYEMLYEKYPFAKFDRSIEYECENIEYALIEYARNNIEQF